MIVRRTRSGALAGGAYDDDDKDADGIWDAVDSYMDERRRVSCVCMFVRVCVCLCECECL